MRKQCNKTYSYVLKHLSHRAGIRRTFVSCCLCGIVIYTEMTILRLGECSDRQSSYYLQVFRNRVYSRQPDEYYCTQLSDLFCCIVDLQILRPNELRNDFQLFYSVVVDSNQHQQEIVSIEKV